MRTRVLAVTLACGLLTAAAPAFAQGDYPSRPIRVTVPFAAGGGIDITARIATEKMSEILGQQIVVQNQGGAGGSIATAAIVKADADGYNLLYHSTTGTVHSAITDKLSYDWLNDLVPVSIITRFAPVMVISPKLPAKNMKEFVALLKAEPGKYSFASSGAGSAVHLAAEFFLDLAGVKMVHVPYRGTVAAMPDMLSGRIAMMVDGVPPQAKNIQNGIVTAVAVTTSTRSPAIPDIPTMKELGYNFEVPFWTAIYAPKNTPKSAIDKIAAAAQKAMKDPAVVKRLSDIGTESVGSTAAELDKLNREQFALYRQIIKKNPGLLGGK
ncbi:MAG: tripartite tricarboxylate transporter substrate binding protein [Alphaproteobacteria bacterium]|nr:tripartite tricarboxylate transporter substrate binding protein [Alphaproteobacteria bacterium]